MKLGAVSGLITPVPGVDPAIGRVYRAAELGLDVLGVSFMQDADRAPAHLQAVAEAGAAKGIELRLGGGGGEFGNPDPEVRKRELERATQSLLYLHKHTGIKFSMVANRPMSHNRWAPIPPMDERIDMIGEYLALMADAVAPVGMVLGLENHCDYRGYEIAAMLKRANRPNMMAQIDTGNPFTVFEDPIDCATAMAPYVVSSHLKDIRVTPLAGAPVFGARTETVPLGQGHVDNVAICQILQDKSPDPRSLALMMEPLLTNVIEDKDAFVRESLDWARVKLAKFLS